MGLDDAWAQAPSLSKIATIFARTFALMGKCRFPLYISQSLAGERFDIWRMINERRMTRYEWSFAGSEAEQKSSHPSILSFRSIAERYQARAPRRYLRARRLTSREDDGEVWDDDSFLEKLSAGESLSPDPSDPSLNLPCELLLPLASADPRLTFSSTKRSGDTLESGSTREGKKEEGPPRGRENANASNGLTEAC